MPALLAPASISLLDDSATLPYVISCSHTRLASSKRFWTLGASMQGSKQSHIDLDYLRIVVHPAPTIGDAIQEQCGSSLEILVAQATRAYVAQLSRPATVLIVWLATVPGFSLPRSAYHSLLMLM